MVKGGATQAEVASFFGLRIWNQKSREAKIAGVHRTRGEDCTERDLRRSSQYSSQVFIWTLSVLKWGCYWWLEKELTKWNKKEQCPQLTEEQRNHLFPLPRGKNLLMRRDSIRLKRIFACVIEINFRLSFFVTHLKILKKINPQIKLFQ